MPAIVLLTVDWLFLFRHLVYKYLSILLCSAGKWMDCQGYVSFSLLQCAFTAVSLTGRCLRGHPAETTKTKPMTMMKESLTFGCCCWLLLS